MRVVIVGTGPVGLYSAIALARRGHEVTVIDRDGGARDPEWSSRRGVMQFHHPHFFREQVRQALEAEIPEVWAALLEAGAVPVTNAGPRPSRPGFATAAPPSNATCATPRSASAACACASVTPTGCCAPAAAPQASRLTAVAWRAIWSWMLPAAPDG